MRFPRCPGPPRWYWRLPTKWRQRYCRWYVWKWEAVHEICTRVLTRRVLLESLPEAMSFSWYLLRADLDDRRRNGGSNPAWSDIIGLQRSYWAACWRSWRGGGAEEGLRCA